MFDDILMCPWSLSSKEANPCLLDGCRSHGVTLKKTKSHFAVSEEHFGAWFLPVINVVRKSLYHDRTRGACCLLGYEEVRHASLGLHHFTLLTDHRPSDNKFLQCGLQTYVENPWLHLATYHEKTALLLLRLFLLSCRRAITRRRIVCSSCSTSCAHILCWKFSRTEIRDYMKFLEPKRPTLSFHQMQSN